MTVIALPKILTDKLTDEGAHASVEILDKVENETQKVTLEIAEEKFEKRLAQLDTKIEKSAAHLEAKIENVRADLIKWMFIFWIGQVTTITAILMAFFK